MFREHRLAPEHEHEAGRSRVYPVLVIIGLLLTLLMILIVVGGPGDWWHRTAPLDTFDPAGKWAQKIMDLAGPVFITAGVVFVAVEGLILFIAFRFRQDPDESAEEGEQPRQTHGHAMLEVVWTGVPFLVLLILAVLTVDTLFALTEPDDQALQIRVSGQQWWWAYEYDIDNDGFGYPVNDQLSKNDDPDPEIITADELVIPAGRDVQLTITSRDVIHSFWIPRLNGKRDAVPGRQSTWKIQADKPGRYRGQCTEFCGLSHARMQMYVVALPEDQFNAWVEHQRQGTVEKTRSDFETDADFEQWQRGKELFVNQCTTCHLVRGLEQRDPDTGDVTYTSDDYWAQGGAAQVSGTAPDLTHLMSRETFAGAVYDLYLNIDSDTSVDNYLTKDGLQIDYAQLQAWVRNPSALKPMAPDPVIPNPHGDQPPLVGRGMPDLGLSEEQIDDVVAYITSLD